MSDETKKHFTQAGAKYYSCDECGLDEKPLVLIYNGDSTSGVCVDCLRTALKQLEDDIRDQTFSQVPAAAK